MKIDENEAKSIESEESESECDAGFTDFPEASLISEKLVKKKTYILGMTATSFSNPTVAVSTSNHCVTVFNFDEDFRESAKFKPDADEIVSLQFSEDEDNLLWIGSNNGCIDLWDLRTPDKQVSRFTDTTDTKAAKDKKFNCFDISSNRRLLCAGTDEFEGDCFLLFWDIRNCNLLGGFWESHTNDITQVKFHPTNPNKMISGSTDGLINIYDLTQSSEDDALIDSLNTESSIEKLGWSGLGQKDIISCITHTADVQLWKSEDVQPFCDFKRSDVGSYSQIETQYVYVVDVHITSKDTLILAGCNESVGGLKLEGKRLKPAFRLHNNEQRVRCSWYDENTKLLLTGGERSYLNAWKVTENIL